MQPQSQSLRDLLFGDLPIDQWPSPGSPANDHPWSTFATARSLAQIDDVSAAAKLWRFITDDATLETRHRLQAWQFLRQHGQTPPPAVAKKVLGIVIEVGMPEGTDLLAAYADHTARYYNYSGAAIVWEHPNDSLDSTIDGVLATAAQVVSRIGPWDRARPAVIEADCVRLCMLTPSGLHFGQGLISVISQDSLGGPLFAAGAGLMQALIAQTRNR